MEALEEKIKSFVESYKENDINFSEFLGYMEDVGVEFETTRLACSYSYDTLVVLSSLLDREVEIETVSFAPQPLADLYCLDCTGLLQSTGD